MTLTTLFNIEKKIILRDLQSELMRQSSINGRYRVSVLTFITQSEDPIKYLQKSKPDLLIISVKNFNTFSLAYLRFGSKDKSNEISEGTICIFRGEHKDTWHIATDGNSFFNDRIFRMIEDCHSTFTRVYFSTEELQDILEQELYIPNKRVLIGKRLKTVLQGVETDQIKIHDERLHTQIFEDAKNEDRKIFRFEFDVRSPVNNHSLLQAQITRDGIAKYYNGDIDLFWNSLLPEISKAASRKGALLRGRARKPATAKLYPLEIEFGSNVLNTRTDNDRLIQVLSGLRKVGVTVFHNNPYLHVSYLDFYDGSTFDVFAISSKKLSIIPGFYASEFALMRLCDSINTYFQEGKMRNAVVKKPSASSFWGIAESEG